MKTIPDREDFFVKERKRMLREARKLLLIAWIVNLVAMSILYFVGGSELLQGDIFIILVILEAIMVVATLLRLLMGKRIKIVVHPGSAAKEEVKRIVNDEIARVGIQVEEYIYHFASGKTPHGEKLVLLPSYLVLCKNGYFIAIPTNKIFWICVQVGQKGRSSFVVRLLIFAENKRYELTGANVLHMEEMADKIHQHIPDIFSEYDPFILSYKMDELFKKDYQQFVQICEAQKLGVK